MAQSDTIKTSVGDLEMFFIGHGSLMFQYNDKVIHIDPVSEMGDYSSLPKADIMLITHEHHDHFEPETIEKLRKDDTDLVVAEVCANQVENGIVMKNGDKQTFKGIPVEAVPAYNIIHMRSPGQPFHPKGVGNGYVLTFGDKQVYVAGDTENIPEMKDLSDINIAFLPMNLPYTMTPELAADAALSFKPKILYPYHFGNTETSKLVDLLKDHPEIEVRIRDLQ
ncbi:MAG: MBL fold metallo-hydrolase [Deltaproteobacteria bacterium]|nr:MBL fold metallo-hydrolase [Deltaproteobacteria bacterium]